MNMNTYNCHFYRRQIVESYNLVIATATLTHLAGHVKSLKSCHAVWPAICIPLRQWLKRLILDENMPTPAPNFLAKPTLHTVEHVVHLCNFHKM